MIAPPCPPLVPAAIVATSRVVALHAYLHDAATMTTRDDAVPAALRAAVRAYRALDASLPSTVSLPDGGCETERGPRDRRVRDRWWRATTAALLGAPAADAAPSAAVCAARVLEALRLGWEPYARAVWPAAAQRVVEWCAAARAIPGAGSVGVVPVARAANAATLHATALGPRLLVDVSRVPPTAMADVVMVALGTAPRVDAVRDAWPTWRELAHGGALGVPSP